MLKFIVEQSVLVEWFAHMREHACSNLSLPKLLVFLLFSPLLTVIFLILDALALIGLAIYAGVASVFATALWMSTQLSWSGAFALFFSLQSLADWLRDNPSSTDEKGD